jgi:hypothetical protein
MSQVKSVDVMRVLLLAMTLSIALFLLWNVDRHRSDTTDPALHVDHFTPRRTVDRTDGIAPMEASSNTVSYVKAHFDSDKPPPPLPADPRFSTQPLDTNALSMRLSWRNQEDLHIACAVRSSSFHG